MYRYVRRVWEVRFSAGSRVRHAPRSCGLGHCARSLRPPQKVTPYGRRARTGTCGGPERCGFMRGAIRRAPGCCSLRVPAFCTRHVAAGPVTARAGAAQSAESDAPRAARPYRYVRRPREVWFSAGSRVRHAPRCCTLDHCARARRTPQKVTPHGRRACTGTCGDPEKCSFLRARPVAAHARLLRAPTPTSARSPGTRLGRCS